MNDFILNAFGDGKDLEWWQRTARAVLIFVLAIMPVRLSDRQLFGMKSLIDNVITILPRAPF